MMASERDQTTKHLFLRRIREIPNVDYLGFVEDVPTLFQQVDAFVLPSHREGVPRSIIEAMASAKPVIATNIRPPRRSRRGENGLSCRSPRRQKTCQTDEHTRRTPGPCQRDGTERI
ncbi:glycosyltransferase [Exiguobacterium sp. SL14]|nr:glycosyltransferase [Exiguobacterium sp. SL14]MCY1689986.1 glycosyltransferase [Exiguobacterium sp. SL14]